MSHKTWDEGGVQLGAAKFSASARTDGVTAALSAPQAWLHSADVRYVMNNELGRISKRLGCYQSTIWNFLR